MTTSRIGIACLLLSMGAIAPPSTHAGFSLGDGTNYAVAANVGSKAFHLSSDSGVTGNVGLLYTSSNPFQLSNGTINGNVDLQGASSGTTGGTVTGSINTNVSALTTLYSSLASLSSTLGAESGTTIGAGTSTINASSGTLDGSGNSVFTITANNFSNLANTVTINGTASQFVVINVTGNNNVSFSAFTLTGGITPDQVLFNILGSNQNVQVSKGHGGTIDGDILAINDNVNMDNATLDGRIFGGDASNFQIVSGFYVFEPATTTTAAAVPEPAGLVLGFLALVSLGLFIGVRRLRLLMRTGTEDGCHGLLGLIRVGARTRPAETA